MSKLGVYWSVSHRRPQDYEYFRWLQPSVMKVMDGGDNDYAWIKANLPNSLVVARIHALSEQHDDLRRDPVGTGKRHAGEWNNHAQRLGFDKAKTLILGINEPRIWDSGVPEALRQYTIAMCEEATRLGLRVGAMQLSVGWPGNHGPDTPPDWSPFGGVEDAIKRNNGALVLHEYFAELGPAENWGWWCGRAFKCPWNVPIVIGECGLDMGVKHASFEKQKRGWLANMTPKQYAAALREYTARMSADPRFVGCAVFASDFADDDWYSFDVEPAYRAIMATPEPPDVPRPVTKYVTATAGLWLRSAPAVDDANKLLVVPYGKAVSVTGTTGEWAQVTFEFTSGYMYSGWLSEQEPDGPVDPPVEPPTDKWQRSIEWVLGWEGGYQNVANDKGNWTGCEVGKGENKGTNFGISACSYPTLDIRNLTREQAIAIYERDYWQRSGAASLPWPACLLVLDTAVLHGVGTATTWLGEVGPNPYLFAAKRLRVYPKLPNWDFWGKAWVNRVADLLEEMAT